MRRFNYTGRHRIRRQDVEIRACTTDAGLEVDCIVDWSDLRSKEASLAEALVFLEVQDEHRWQRFDLGEVGAPGRTTGLRLDDFHPSERPSFRLKVVRPAHGGVIAALLRNVRPSMGDEAPARSLLPVAVEPLDDLVFRVELREEGPVLVLNRDLDETGELDPKSVARRPEFIALVYPQAVHDVLAMAFMGPLAEAGPVDPDDGEDWRAPWLRFAQRLHPSATLNDDDPTVVREAINDVVAALARRIGAAARLRTHLLGEARR